MNITTKYNLGQSVFTVRRDFATRIIKCRACENTRKVTIREVEYVCPKCHGTANSKEHCGQKWFVWEKGEIGKIDYEITAGKYASSNSNMPRYFSDEQLAAADEIQIRYMIDATGVGSGTLWEEEDLFPTREEAQAKCDAENANLPKDECEAAQ